MMKKRKNTISEEMEKFLGDAKGKEAVKNLEIDLNSAFTLNEDDVQNTPYTIDLEEGKLKNQFIKEKEIIFNTINNSKVDVQDWINYLKELINNLNEIK